MPPETISVGCDLVRKIISSLSCLAPSGSKRTALSTHREWLRRSSGSSGFSSNRASIADSVLALVVGQKN